MSRLRAVRDHDPLKVPHWNDEFLNSRSEVHAKPLTETVLDRGVDRAFEEVDDRLVVESLLAEMKVSGASELDRRITERLFHQEHGESLAEVADDLGIALSTLKEHRKQLRSPDGPLFRLLGRG